MKIIQSERHLAWTLGFPIKRLKRIADTPADHYHEFQRKKASNPAHVRTIRNPDDELKEIQRRIKDRVFGNDIFGSEVQGGVPGRSPKSNAEMHLGAGFLVTADVKGFYDNVDHWTVFETLRELGYGTDVSRLLTKLTTRKGMLPQGAPTSTILANLVLRRPVDAPTRAQADSLDTVFTRFVDDIALSGAKNPAPLIGDIARRLSSRGLSIHRGEKLKIRPRSMPQKITGLIINSGKPTVPQKYLDSVRAAIHELLTITDPTSRTAAVRSIAGRIAHVWRFQPGAADRLTNQLARIVR
jgi:RNA-directed DNA polymerase